MNAKNYLNQAYRLDQRIHSKLEQIQVLNALATKCTSVISGMPKAQGRNASSMEEAVCKIIDLEHKIGKYVEELVAIKLDLMKTIEQVDDFTLQIILEKRYLSYESWERIADEINCTLRWTYVLRDRAIKKVGEILEGTR